jgi:hypothetical protein
MENRSPSPRSRQLSTYFPRFLKLGAHREGDGEETPSTLPTPREPLLSISSTPPLQLETNLETENTQPAQNLNDSQHSTSLPNLSSSAPLQGKYKNGKGLGKGKNGDKFIDEDDDEESEESSSDLEDDGESGSTEDW